MRYVEVRRHRKIHFMLNVLHDSNDLHPGVLLQRTRVAHALADRISVRPVLPRESFVDDDDWLRAGLVLLSEGAASQHRDPHRAKVIRSANSIAAVELLSGSWLGKTFNQKAGGGIGTAERQGDDGRGRPHPRRSC